MLRFKKLRMKLKHLRKRKILKTDPRSSKPKISMIGKERSPHKIINKEDPEWFTLNFFSDNFHLPDNFESSSAESPILSSLWQPSPSKQNSIWRPIVPAPRPIVKTTLKPLAKLKSTTHYSQNQFEPSFTRYTPSLTIGNIYQAPTQRQHARPRTTLPPLYYPESSKTPAPKKLHNTINSAWSGNWGNFKHLTTKKARPTYIPPFEPYRPSQTYLPPTKRPVKTYLPPARTYLPPVSPSSISTTVSRATRKDAATFAVTPTTVGTNKPIGTTDNIKSMSNPQESGVTTPSTAIDDSITSEGVDISGVSQDMMSTTREQIIEANQNTTESPPSIFISNLFSLLPQDDEMFLPTTESPSSPSGTSLNLPAPSLLPPSIDFDMSSDGESIINGMRNINIVIDMTSGSSGFGQSIEIENNITDGQRKTTSITKQPPTSITRTFFNPFNIFTSTTVKNDVSTAITSAASSVLTSTVLSVPPQTTLQSRTTEKTSISLTEANDITSKPVITTSATTISTLKASTRTRDRTSMTTTTTTTTTSTTPNSSTSSTLTATMNSTTGTSITTTTTTASTAAVTTTTITTTTPKITTSTTMPTSTITTTTTIASATTTSTTKTTNITTTSTTTMKLITSDTTTTKSPTTRIRITRPRITRPTIAIQRVTRPSLPSQSVLTEEMTDKTITMTPNIEQNTSPMAGSSTTPATTFTIKAAATEVDLNDTNATEAIRVPQTATVPIEDSTSIPTTTEEFSNSTPNLETISIDFLPTSITVTQKEVTTSGKIPITDIVSTTTQKAQMINTTTTNEFFDTIITDDYGSIDEDTTEEDASTTESLDDVTEVTTLFTAVTTQVPVDQSTVMKKRKNEEQEEEAGTGSTSPSVKNPESNITSSNQFEIESPLIDMVNMIFDVVTNTLATEPETKIPKMSQTTQPTVTNVTPTTEPTAVDSDGITVDDAMLITNIPNLPDYESSFDPLTVNNIFQTTLNVDETEETTFIREMEDVTTSSTIFGSIGTTSFVNIPEATIQSDTTLSLSVTPKSTINLVPNLTITPITSRMTKFSSTTDALRTTGKLTTSTIATTNYYDDITDDYGSSLDDYDENTSIKPTDEPVTTIIPSSSVKTTSFLTPIIDVVTELTIKDIETTNIPAAIASELDTSTLPTEISGTTTVDLSNIPITIPTSTNALLEITTTTNDISTFRAVEPITSTNVDDDVQTTTASTQMIMGSTVVTSQPLDVFEVDDSNFLSSLFQGLDVDAVDQQVNETNSDVKLEDEIFGSISQNQTQVALENNTTSFLTSLFSILNPISETESPET